MKRCRLSDLRDIREGHFLQGIVPEPHLCAGGMGFKAPGSRTHTGDGPGSSDRHVHEGVHEVFVILQGKAVMELDGARYPLVTGDVFVVEPGEDHHLVSDEHDPCVNLWLEAGRERHRNQRAPG